MDELQFFSIFIYCAESSDLKPSQDFVGEPGIRPGSQTKSVGSARVSETSPRTLSGRVGSGRVRVVEFGTGPTRLCRWSDLVVSFLNSTARTRPDMSAPATRSPTKSAVRVEFSTRTHGLCLQPDRTRPTDKVRTCRD